MNCPNCNEVLIMSERQGVEIDYCPKCRGVWLDRGELDKIIDKSYAEESRNTGSSYNQPDSDEYYNRNPNKPYRKKRGFLGDMFDFD